MKKLLTSAIVLSFFALSLMFIQISCTKDDDVPSLNVQYEVIVADNLVVGDIYKIEYGFFNTNDWKESQMANPDKHWTGTFSISSSRKPIDPILKFNYTKSFDAKITFNCYVDGVFHQSIDHTFTKGPWSNGAVSIHFLPIK